MTKQSDQSQRRADEWSGMMSDLGKEVFTSQDIFTTMRFSDLTIEEMFPATMSFGNSRMFLYTGIAQCQRMAEALEKYKTAGYDATKMSEQDQRLLPQGSITAISQQKTLTKIVSASKNVCRHCFELRYHGHSGVVFTAEEPTDKICEDSKTHDTNGLDQLSEDEKQKALNDFTATIRIKIISKEKVETPTDTTPETLAKPKLVGPHWEPREVDDFLNKWNKYKTDKEPYDEDNLAVIINELSPYNQNLMWWCMAWEPIQRAHYNLLYAVGSRTFKGFIELGKNLYERAQEQATGQRRRFPWSKKKEDDSE